MKKLFVKSVLFLGVTCVGFSGLSYAISEFNYNSALQIANEYIANSSFDENWKDHNPRITTQGKEFHTDSDSDVSYLEFKVSCDNNIDCGFIMVNFDGDDVSIPVASTSGNTPSELILAQNGGNVEDNKLYYFSPFDMYGENTINQEVSSVDPVDNIDQTLNQDKKLTKEEKKEKRKASKLALKDKIKSMKQEAGDYKKTDDFKKKRKELKDKKQTVPRDDKFSYKILPFANATNPGAGGSGYIQPSNISNIFVSGNSYAGCNGKLPCYDQDKNINYNGKTCSVGCVPTAYTILFGYYDRKGTFPNLITGTASTTGSIVESNLKSLLGHTYMNTTCSGSEGLTTVNNGMNGAVNYAKSVGYNNTIGTPFVSNIFSNIKTEINAGRPVILGNGDHSIVGYGYYDTTDTTKQIIRVNLGYGALYNVTNSAGTIFYGSSIDYNLNSLYYNKSNQPGVSTLVKLIISN